MADRYACFTTPQGEQTWWELVPGHKTAARMILDRDGNPFPYGDRTSVIRSRDDHSEDASSVRSDHEELPDEVLVALTMHILTKGEVQ